MNSSCSDETTNVKAADVNIEIPYIESAIPNTEKPKRRLSDSHIPILDVSCRKQPEIDSIFSHLAEGNKRMSAIELSMSDYHKIAAEDRQRLEKKQDLNNAETSELLEIVRMGRGFFKGAQATGKWVRRVIMWFVPPVVAIVGLWQALKPPK